MEKSKLFLSDKLFEKGKLLNLKLLDEMEFRMQGLVTPRFDLGLNVRRKRTFEEVRTLAFLSWTLPTLGSLLRADIRDFCMRSWKWEDRLEVEFLLISQENLQKYLNLTFSERDWFGNQLPRILKMQENLHFVVYSPPKIKRQERIRGYRDHGTLKPPHRWLERFDWSLNLLHVKVEARRKLFKECLTYLETTESLMEYSDKPFRRLIEEILRLFNEQDFRTF